MKGQIEFGGLPWKKPGELVTYGINSLVSNILCKCHNEALSPLDTEHLESSRRYTKTLALLINHFPGKESGF